MRSLDPFHPLPKGIEWNENIYTEDDPLNSGRTSHTRLWCVPYKMCRAHQERVFADGGNDISSSSSQRDEREERERNKSPSERERRERRERKRERREREREKERVE